MAQLTFASPTIDEPAPALALAQWQLRPLPTGGHQAYIPVGEVFAGAAELWIVLEPEDPGIGWPKVAVITRGSAEDGFTRLIIAAVDELDIDLDAAIASAKEQAADHILTPLGSPRETGIDQLTADQLAELRAARQAHRARNGGGR